MSCKKRAAALLLAAAVLWGAGIPAAAAHKSPTQAQYPLVFVHGMFGWGENEGINKLVPYWGATTGSLGDYLHEQGYACHFASVGPLSSAWDRACELYAQLTGATVDYGEAHAREYGHARYGRTYDTPMLSDWNEAQKIHLIGHSYGGNTVRLLAHLLTYGSQEEQRIGGDDVSPLFMGGKEGWVCSVTTICSPHNGTTAYPIAEKMNLMPVMAFVGYNYAGIMGRSPFNGVLVDFHMEQFGLTDTPGEKDAHPLPETIARLWRTQDNVQHGLSPGGAAQFNEMIETSPNIYYFSYAYDCTGQNGEGRGRTLACDRDFFLLSLTSQIMQGYNHRRGGITSNDGLVDVPSALAPADEPAAAFDSENITPGLWQTMPVRRGDHGTPVGLFSSRAEVRALYDEITALLLLAE